VAQSSVLVPNFGEKPTSDIDSAAVDSLKALDPNRPIREADMVASVDRFHVQKPTNST